MGDWSKSPAEQVLALGEGLFRPPYPGHVLPDDESGRDPTAVPERRGRDEEVVVPVRRPR